MALKLSIITPAYNASQTIAETIQSILAQTSPDWEAIIVDDGSTDETARIIKAYVRADSRVRLVQRANGGESAARNCGIAEAKYDWLAFLDADDWIAPTYLERMTSELISNPALDVVHCGSARVTVDGTIIAETRKAPTGDLFPSLARYNEFPVHACVVRKSMIDLVGGFDTSLIKCPDWDLWQRIARAGAKFGAVREELAFYRMRHNAASMDAFQMLRDGLRVLRRGHSADARVPRPVPAYAFGLPSNNIAMDEYYLASWYAGVLLGQGKDARSLLELIDKNPYPQLSPDSVAEGIFEMVPIVHCKAPNHWQQLFESIRINIQEFLTALEERSQTIGLAENTMSRLRQMIRSVMA